MLHVYAITDVRDGSIVGLYRSLHGTAIALVGHTSVFPRLNGVQLDMETLESALAETAWIIVDYPAHDLAGSSMPAARLKVSREYLGA